MRSMPPVSPSQGSRTPRDMHDDGAPPASRLRRVQDYQPREEKEVSVPDLKPIKPTFIRPTERIEVSDENAQPAPPSVVPRLSRKEYYSFPSIEAMSRMSEEKLSRIDNLEIGRYGFGSIKWPGLTDVRRLDFDSALIIEKGSVILFPDREKPPVGESLNKEAVVTLNVRPSRSDGKARSADVLKARLQQISENFGGTFISYDMEKWIFRVPHFSVADDRS